MTDGKYQNRWTKADERRQAEELRRLRLRVDGEEPAEEQAETDQEPERS